ncbi:MAG TPA: serine/threonine-protein kinase [Chloroflexaceae bacterium]|nr:serine/threonine-protein kinase [Chloroflexaceae bacterium]
MLCPSCTSEVAAGTAFCPECGTRMPQAAPPLRVLQGRYELTRKLGQGGMGAVYLASDRRLSTARWAVKELSDAQITSPLERQQAAASFRQEAEMLAALAHPNLPRVIDSFTEDGRSYLVMEFVPGETLYAYAQRVGLPRPLPEVLGWARQLCAVLGYLHARQPPVIFRDLKPANVMLTPDGSLKLIDFGIARHFKAGKRQDTQAFGTVGYSAPEQYGRGQTDARSDIYSLSVLLHHLLTGYDPANTPFRVPPAAQLNPALPAEVSAVLAQGMHHDPGQRYASVEAFGNALLGAGNHGAPASVQPREHPAAPAAAVAARQSAAPGVAAGPQATTGLARTAMWLGSGSAALMALGTLLVVVGAASGDPESALPGLGALLAILPTMLGPTAATLGVVALSRRATQATARGRRDALIGVATGVLALMLCCGLLAAFPSTTEGAGASGARAATFSTAMARVSAVPGPATHKERYG